MPYDIINHPLLSVEAKALGSQRLDAEQRVAERVLGLTGTSYADAAQLGAEDALAMQVSLQVAADPMAFLAASETKGIDSVTYRSGVPLHPLSVEITAALLIEDQAEGVAIQPGGSASVPLNFSF